MKKSQSIFLLSGLVPLVAAPIAIVASCSNDTTAVKSESQVEAERLNGLIQSSKIKILSGKETLNDAMLAEINNNPNKLLSDYLDKKELALNEEKFTYNIAELAGVEPKQDTTAKTISFKFRVVNKTNAGETYDSVVASVAYQYQATGQNPSAEQTLVNNAVAEIEKAHQAKTFKLKPAKETIAKNDIDALAANPANFLSEYTDGLPQINSPLSATVKKGNLSFAPKQSLTRQQQAQHTITFKVTVSHTTAKVESDTQNLTFDFTLQDTASPNKVATAAKTGVTATALGLQADKVPVAQTKLNQAWVVANITKLLDGDQEVTADNDTLALTVTPNNQDSTKLTLSFKLAPQKWYQADGTLGSAESAVFSFDITGFTKADQAQVKKTEFEAGELGTDFATKTFAELNTVMNSSAWLFDNREKYLSGDLVPGTNARNFVQQSGTPITFTQKANDQTKADMTFSIATGRSYDDQGRVTTTPTRITFTVTNIRQP